jgi:putative membrane protein
MKMKKQNSFLEKAVCLVFLFCLPSLASQAQITSKLSDSEIASVAVVANQNDIGFAKIAKQKSKNAEVLKFAETMANDHKAVIDQAVALVKKLGVTPKDNPVSKKMVADASKTRKMLQAESGKAFEKSYIDNEVSYHKAVISAVETLLIPQANNAELKSLLQNVVPTLKAHLEHAKMVQKQIIK